MCVIFYIKTVLNYYFGTNPTNKTTTAIPPQGIQMIPIDDLNQNLDCSNKNWSINRVLNNEMLSDNEIYQALLILKQQFQYRTNLKGFFDPQLFNARFIKSNKISVNTTADSFIQILHDGQLHWYTLTNINTNSSNHIKVYDSYFMKKTYDNNRTFINSLKKLISNNLSDIILLDSQSHIKKELNIIECTIETVQIQSEAKLCGLYSIAFAFDLCSGIDPATQIYDESKMREHLFQCLSQKQFTEFPKNNVSILNTNPFQTIYVSI